MIVYTPSILMQWIHTNCTFILYDHDSEFGDAN